MGTYYGMICKTCNVQMPLSHPDSTKGMFLELRELCLAGPALAVFSEIVTRNFPPSIAALRMPSIPFYFLDIDVAWMVDHGNHALRVIDDDDEIDEGCYLPVAPAILASNLRLPRSWDRRARWCALTYGHDGPCEPKSRNTRQCSECGR